MKNINKKLLITFGIFIAIALMIINQRANGDFGTGVISIILIVIISIYLFIQLIEYTGDLEYTQDHPLLASIVTTFIAVFYILGMILIFLEHKTKVEKADNQNIKIVNTLKCDEEGLFKLNTEYRFFNSVEVSYYNCS